LAATRRLSNPGGNRTPVPRTPEQSLLAALAQPAKQWDQSQGYDEYCDCCVPELLG